MRDPSCVEDKVQAASWDTVGAYLGTGVPLDNLDVDTQRVPEVYRTHHTWAPRGSWPWGSAEHRKECVPSVAASGRGSSRST